MSSEPDPSTTPGVLPPQLTPEQLVEIHAKFDRVTAQIVANLNKRVAEEAEADLLPGSPMQVARERIAREWAERERGMLPAAENPDAA